VKDLNRERQLSGEKSFLRLLSFAFLAFLLADRVVAEPGDLFVTDNTNGAIVKITPDGIKKTFASDLLKSLSGVAFDAKGNVYVAERGSGNIYLFTPVGDKSTFFSGLSSPSGLAFDGAGNLYVTEFFAGRVTEITPAGKTGTIASGLSGPNGLAFDRAGNLYVGESSAGKIKKITPTGASATFASGFSAPSGPFGMAFDSADNLFVADITAGTVSKITPDGTKSVYASGLISPTGIVFDPKGDLFVAEANPARVSFFTPVGSRVPFVNLDGFPYFITFEPPPHQLLNISTRGLVGTGNDALIAGFILGGNGQTDGTIVARALGASLIPLGIPNALRDPTLELHNASGVVVASNDNWMDGPQHAQIQLDGLAPANDFESALLAKLPSGNYTAIVRGANNTTGVALVEVYNLP